MMVLGTPTTSPPNQNSGVEKQGTTTFNYLFSFSFFRLIAFSTRYAVFLSQRFFNTLSNYFSFLSFYFILFYFLFFYFYRFFNTRYFTTFVFNVSLSTRRSRALGCQKK